MQYLNSHSYVFKRPVRRRRIGQLMLALSALTAVNATFMAARASAQDTFDRLVDRPARIGQSLAENGRGTYGLVGGEERFEFSRNGRSATIRFLCAPGPACNDAVRKANPLSAEPGGRGDMVFNSADGVMVLRVTATGGATLFGGAAFVPTTVPRSGRAVVPE